MMDTNNYLHYKLVLKELYCENCIREIYCLLVLKELYCKTYIERIIL